MARNRRTPDVAHAEPTAPRAGNPRLPYMNTQLSRTLRTLATIIAAMAGLGRFRPSRKNDVATKTR